MRLVMVRSVALALSFAVSGFTYGTEITPRAGRLALQDFQATTLSAMRETERVGFNAYSDRLSPTLRKYVAVSAMSAVMLGDDWQTLTPAQQTEFSDLFGQIFLLTLRDAFRSTGVSSMGQMETFAGDIFQPTGTKSIALCESLKLDRCDSLVVVSNKVGDTSPSGGVLKLGYQLMPTADGWVIVDVSINGLSVLTSYASQNRRILKNQGADRLLSEMRSLLQRIQSRK
ncbi:phospholipid-binding protein MlaC [Massilia sp. MS-15]|uniref:MlaC/ttg2D family ABC transporter substrate-binding protein n=1 Tax=Massilia sp. MS-15 TaxID=2878200 RepID=UPI001CD29805|nr:ABC transporter substrate-binding protein [Massilia sp. MS-15]MCA1244982.1 ABC transporter substrate-binding protein [Massilia sp. MS-15]